MTWDMQRAQLSSLQSDSSLFPFFFSVFEGWTAQVIYKFCARVTWAVICPEEAWELLHCIKLFTLEIWPHLPEFSEEEPWIISLENHRTLKTFSVKRVLHFSFQGLILCRMLVLTMFFEGSFALCTFTGMGFKDGQAVPEVFSPHSEGHHWEL